MPSSLRMVIRSIFCTDPFFVFGAGWNYESKTLANKCQSPSPLVHSSPKRGGKPPCHPENEVSRPSFLLEQRRIPGKLIRLENGLHWIRVNSFYGNLHFQVPNFKWWLNWKNNTHFMFFIWINHEHLENVHFSQKMCVRKHVGIFRSTLIYNNLSNETVSCGDWWFWNDVL